MWNPYGYQQQNPAYAGYAYAASQPAPVLNNFLTPEQIAEIQQNPQLFPTKLTRDEFLRSICTHKQNNMIKLEKIGDGNHHCLLCGKDFYLFDTNTPDETVAAICKNMYDLIQSIKTYLLNAPEALKDIYMVLGFIEKFPVLWKTAVKGFEQASNATAFGLQSNPQMDAFQMLGNVFGGQMMGGFYGQQPMGYPQQAWQAGYQQPVAPPPAPQAPVAPQPAAPQPPVYTNGGYVIPNNPVMPQQPVAGYPIQTPMQQPYPMMGNPIGQVEPQVPGPVVAPPTAPVAEAVNPNLQTPEKVDVNKAFTPAA